MTTWQTWTPLLLFLAALVSYGQGKSVYSFKQDEPTPTPPAFPAAFSISFEEIEVLGKTIRSSNNGTWYYDYSNHRARFDHGYGQTNNFCDGQGLSPKDAKAGCQLLFTPNEDLYVIYPEPITCCRLCGKEQGCTILRPDWLKEGAKLISTEIINGVKCYGWGKPGIVAAYDTWFADWNGTPCRYHEEIIKINLDHNLTFIRSTFKFEPQPDYLFDVPETCVRDCPHPYPPRSSSSSS